MLEEGRGVRREVHLQQRLSCPRWRVSLCHAPCDFGHIPVSGLAFSSDRPPWAPGQLHEMVRDGVSGTGGSLAWPAGTCRPERELCKEPRGRDAPASPLPSKSSDGFPSNWQLGVARPFSLPSSPSGKSSRSRADHPTSTPRPPEAS